MGKRPRPEARPVPVGSLRAAAVIVCRQRRRARVCTVVVRLRCRYVSQDFSAGVICALPLACFNALAAAGADLFVCQKTHETAAAQCHCQAAASRQYTGDIPVATIIDKRSRLQVTVDGEHRAMEDAFAAAPQRPAPDQAAGTRTTILRPRSAC